MNISNEVRRMTGMKLTAYAQIVTTYIIPVSFLSQIKDYFGNHWRWKVVFALLTCRNYRFGRLFTIVDFFPLTLHREIFRRLMSAHSNHFER
jgi:hypothetical protein